MAVEIHQTAIIEEGAEIGDQTVVGPYSIIRKNVKIGLKNWIGSHVVIEGHTKIGDENKIFQFVSLGSAPQDLSYRNEPTEVKIGNRNSIREYVTIQPGTLKGTGVTSIGNQNLFMAYSHVGHDSEVGNSNVFANSVALAGHVIVGNNAIMGGLAGIHQFCSVGDLAILAGGAMVSKDVPPYCMVQGDRACLIGLNIVGLQRAGISESDIFELKKVYRKIFLSKGKLSERLESLKSHIEGFSFAENMYQFILNSKRGVVMPRRRSSHSRDD